MTNYPFFPFFPIFSDHLAASNWGCFQCGTPGVHRPERDPVPEKGFGDRTEYRFKCPRCGATHFYEVFKDYYGGPKHAEKLAEVRANYHYHRYERETQ